MKKENQVDVVNSREWWEDYFANHWDANGGSKQTLHFMERLIASLALPEMVYLSSTPIAILDWGCAFGEGVDLLARAFPRCKVTGIDCASNAIEEARRRYPERRFILSKDGKISEEFDAIITSNCLEHFENPREMMDIHLRSCKQLYIALVPYNEHPLFEQHLSHFNEESFPQHLGRFVRLYAKQIHVDPAFWKGQQLLVAYASESYSRKRVVAEEEEASEFSAQLVGMFSAQLARMAEQLTEKEQKEQSLVAQVAERQGAVESLAEQLKEKQEKEQSLVGLVAERQSAVEILIEQSKEKERNEQLFVEQAVERQAAMESLSAQLANQHERLARFETQLVEAQQTAQKLVTEFDETEKVIRERGATVERLQVQLSETQQETERLAASNRSLSEMQERNERQMLMLSTQLCAKETQLERMTNSIGWRLLSRYGRIKYRYLLPVYRLLGLAPYGKTSAPRLNAEAQAIQPSSETSDEGVRETQAVAERAAFGDVRDLCESNAFDVICFPIINWDFRFQRPQQLMSRFAAAGHRVFYIAQGFYSYGPAYTIREKLKNVYEVSLRGPARNAYTDALDDEASNELFNSLNTLRRDWMLGATVALAQLPFWWPLAEKTRSEFAWPIVYDCMDYHAGFSTNTQRMINHERNLLASADLVVASSIFLQVEARQHNSNVIVVRNACDYEHFAIASKNGRDRPVIGYYGAIADWFDSDLVADLAQRRPDWDFVLVGSTFSADTSRLSKRHNVSLAGEKHYSEIPGWLSQFDVMIIPFKRTALTEATNPVKAYEVLASGKPLVSVPIPEMAALVPLIRVASNAEEFEREIAAALGEYDFEIVEKRRAFAREHTWERRYDVLAPAVRDVFPKASIIVVTFNNLKLNRMCIESLYARTEWPNFEVIVVDNASSDGTPEFLKQAEASLPGLRVIFNDTNLGFARANNLGLAQATGEYLVLLNNDTVVTRGWLSSLIRHLRADPEIGLIGPVTNEIGNEAKIPVGYTRLEDMPLWAADYIRENDNHLFDIPMLAMFCVAMRKEVFQRVGFLDENFEIGMFEDDDYTRRVRKCGYTVVCTEDAFVHHAGRASFKLLKDERYHEIFEKNRRVYESKWGPWQPHTGR